MKTKYKIFIALFILLLISIYQLIFNKTEEDVSVFEVQESIDSLIEDTNKEKIDEANTNELTEVEDIKEDDNIWGSIDAPVHIIVYCDFTSSFCADFDVELQRVKDEFDNKVAIAFRHMPIQNNEESYSSAQASECAGEQGKFLEMKDKLFEDAKEYNLKNEEYLVDAEELGLDLEEFASCIAGEKYYDKITSHIESAHKTGAIGVPSIFINKRFLSGAYPFEDFKNSKEEEQEGLKTIIEKLLQ